jgi:autotransporter-associated beta strand protein
MSALSAWNNAALDTAIFRGTAGTVTVGANVTVGGLQFDAPAYTLNPGTNTISFGAAENTIRLNTLAQASATTTVGATITGLVGGTGNVTLDGGLAAGLVANTLTLNGTSAGGWSGSTTVGVGQTLALSASNQALANTSAITLRGGAITLTNTTSVEGALNRISNTAPITSNGGTITYANTSGSTYAETIGPVTLSSGALNLFANTNMAAGSQTLTVGAGGITRDGAANTSTLAVLAATAVNTTGNIFVVTGAAATAAGQIVGPWFTTGTAVGNQTDYAAYNAASQVVPAGVLATLPATGATAGTPYQMGASVTLTGGQNILALKNTTAANTLGLGGFNLGTSGILNTFAGTLNISGTGNLTLPSAVSGPLILNPGNGGGIAISSIIADNGAGALTLVVTGGNSVTLTGANTFTGGVVLNSGTLSYNSVAANAALGAAANSITFAGSATLTGTVAGTNARNITLSNGAIATFGNAGIAMGYSGNITGTGGIRINNTTAIATTFSGANNFTGPIDIAVGYFTASSSTATGNASNPVNIANAATTGLVLGSSISIGSLSGGGSSATVGVQLAANTLTVGGNNESTTYAGLITSSGSPTTSLIKTGTSTLTLTGANTFTGGVTINGGLINFSGFSNLGAGTGNNQTLVFGGGGLQFGAAVDISAAGRVNTFNGAAVFDTNGFPVVFANPVGNSGSGGLTKTGNGTLFLPAANTFTGSSSVAGGVLSLQNSQALGTGSAAVSVSAGASLALSGGLDFGSKPLTLAGSGASSGMPGALVSLSGSNTYGGALSLLTDATVAVSAGSLTLGSVAPVTGSGATLTLTGSGNGTLSAGLTTGSGGLVKNGTGTWSLTGSGGTNTGVLSINAGRLNLTGGAIGTPSSTMIGNGILAVSGSEDLGPINVTAGALGRIIANSGSSLGFGAFNRGLGGALLLDGSLGGSLLTTSTGVLGYASVTDSVGSGLAYQDGTNIVRLATFSGGTLTDVTDNAANDFTTAGITTPLPWSNGISTRSVNSLTIDTTSGAQVVDMGATANVLTLTSGAIQMVGANDATLRGGRVGATGAEVIVQQHGAGTLTLGSALSGGAGSLVKLGSGALILTGGITRTTGTLVAGSTVVTVPSTAGLAVGQAVILGAFGQRRGYGCQRSPHFRCRKQLHRRYQDFRRNPPGGSFFSPGGRLAAEHGLGLRLVRRRRAESFQHGHFGQRLRSRSRRQRLLRGRGGVARRGLQWWKRAAEQRRHPHRRRSESLPESLEVWAVHGVFG